MIEQLELLTRPTAPLPPFQKGSDTSRQAAEWAKLFDGPMCARVYEYLVAQGAWGATRNELHLELGMKIQTLCGRLHRLEGKPKRRGDPNTRPLIRKTARQRNGCHVYVALSLIEESQ